MKNSKFLKMFNLIMEQLSDFDLIKNKCYEVLNQMQKQGDSAFSIGASQFAKDERSLNDYIVICSGKGVIKLVKKKQTTGSGDYKMKLSDITLKKVMSNPHFNAIFYVLHNQKVNSQKNQIPFQIYTPSSAGEKQQKESSQIQNFKQQLKQEGDEGVLIQDPNNEVRGPFNNIKKTEGNKPKSDATIYNDKGKTDDKLYVSLKASDGKPVKPGAFNQFGGKKDLDGSDDKIIENSKLINSYYLRIKSLFDKLKITDYDFQSLKAFLQNYNKEHDKHFTATFAFRIPTDSEDLEYLYKTKYGKDFGETKQAGPKNVDVLIDGDMKIQNDKLKGTTHTQWNPSLYSNNQKEQDDQVSKNYQIAVAFAPQEKQGKFKQFRHCRFNTFPVNSGRVKIYFQKTEELFKQFNI